jgi:hypothetical protein
LEEEDGAAGAESEAKSGEEEAKYVSINPETFIDYDNKWYEVGAMFPHIIIFSAYSKNPKEYGVRYYACYFLWEQWECGNIGIKYKISLYNFVPTSVPNWWSNQGNHGATQNSRGRC